MNVEINASKQKFMAYSNILKELKKDYQFDYEDIFFDYVNYVAESDENRESTFYLDNVKLVDNLIVNSNSKKGGAIVSFHYGDYRSLLYTIISDLNTAKIPVALIVDKDSYGKEPKKWIDSEYFTYFLADDINVGLNIVNHINKGGWLILFLDGNAGNGIDRKGIKIPFITSEINIRSGFFRLFSKIEGAKIIPVISKDPNTKEVQVGDFIECYSKDPKVIADNCYELFRKNVKNKPQYWRLWFRHNKQVVLWNKNEDSSIVLSNVVTNILNKKYYINTLTGDIYESDSY